MNTGELKAAIRDLAQDNSAYSNLWKDEEILRFLNEGQVEACRNGRLLKSTSLSLGETRSKCELTVFGTYGVLSAINVGTVNIITNPITYTNDDSITAALLTNEINDTGLFEATVNGTIITLKPLEGNGSFYNNVMPICVMTNSFINATAFSGGIDGICRIQLKPNVREYKFSNKILKFDGFYLGENQKKLCVRDFRDVCDYERNSLKQKGEVCSILYGLSNDSFYVGKTPDKKDFLNMTVYHLPLKTLKNNSDVPEIPEQYHEKLINYALYKMYMKQDIEADQSEISMFHKSLFLEEFGDNQFASAHNNQMNLQFFFGG